MALELLDSSDSDDDDSSLDSSDSDDDDSNGREFLIQANFQKRRKLADDADSTAADQNKVVADARQKVVENVEVKSGSDVSKRKQTRGKGNSNSARGRGSVNNDQTRIQNSASHPSSNGLQENSYQKLKSKHIVAESEHSLEYTCNERDVVIHIEAIVPDAVHFFHFVGFKMKIISKIYMMLESKNGMGKYIKIMDGLWHALLLPINA
ncbi:hypothetical protein Tco_0140326 [Tanacetum coccineum]